MGRRKISDISVNCQLQLEKEDEEKEDEEEEEEKEDEKDQERRNSVTTRGEFADCALIKSNFSWNFFDLHNLTKFNTNQLKPNKIILLLQIFSLFGSKF